MLSLLSNLSPNTAVLILTAGLALIALELNRPGSIVPGASGLLLSLLAAASLGRHHPRPEAVAGVTFCVALLLLQLRREVSLIVVICAAVTLLVAICHMFPPVPGPTISAWAAVLSSLVIAVGTTVLTGVARRARRNKGLD